MTWATQRRILYLLGVGVFFAILTGVPLSIYLHKEPTCFDGIQNQNETSPDHGGPCNLLDESSLIPHAVLWARSFRVRDGIYDAVAYVENPNASAGLVSDKYVMRLYDSENVLVEERTGTMPIMPGGITPVFEGGIGTGVRVATHAIFQLEDVPVWQKMRNLTDGITVSNKVMSDVSSSPRLTATVKNTTVAPLTDITLVAVLFDPAGNAFAASQTAIPRLEADGSEEVIFTWPEPFSITIGRIDVLPVHAPVPIK